MECVNCNGDGKSYTLVAHVDETGTAVDLPFCSTDCLDDWV